MFCFFVILFAEMKTVIGELLCAAACIVFGKRKGLLFLLTPDKEVF